VTVLQCLRPKEAIRIVFRSDDPVRPDDDIVLRAGGGPVENLVQQALANAADYAGLVADGTCTSPYTIFVHVPRQGRATKHELLANPPYSLYRPYLEVPASSLLALDFVQVVATTILSGEGGPTLLDLCHYDVVVAADQPAELEDRAREVRARFTRHDNPSHAR
jgi:acetylornithine deacetylase/succinyl-diaminopimelate desuccinylase-like protein